MKYVVANWKMKMNMSDVTSWLEDFKASYSQSKGSAGVKGVEVIVAPSSLHISYAYLMLDSLEGVAIASQDVSRYEKGSHTGSMGAFQLRDFVKYCIIGHSERAEGREEVLLKRDLLLKEGVIPIICFVSPEDAAFYYEEEEVVLAWEDPENISQAGKYNEKPASEIRQGIEAVRDLLPKEAFLLYGGSVNKNNIQVLKDIDMIDGVLVGQASLDPGEFIELIKAYEIF